jgi:hypothetical protein
MSRVLHMSQHDRAEARIDKSMTTISSMPRGSSQLTAFSVCEFAFLDR